MLLKIRASVICLHNGTLLVFKGIDPHSGENYWFLPGGKIEKTETPWTCAEREALEETGYNIQVIKESETIKQYTHIWNNEEYLCKTFFYKGVLNEPWHEPKTIVDADYNKGATWLDLREAIKYFAYKKEIQEAVMALAT